MSSSQTRLGTAADERKARLAQLRSLKRKQPTPDRDGDPSAPTPVPSRGDNHSEQRRQDGDPTSVSATVLSGRNYDPETRGPKLGFDAPPMPRDGGPTLEQQAAEVESAVREQQAADAAEGAGIDLFKLRPKKANWDLRRDLDRRLAPLDAKTDNVIARMVREQIAEERQRKRGTADADAGIDVDNEGGGGGGGGAGGDEDAGALDGAAFVEGLRAREQEGEEEGRREREDDDLDDPDV